MTLSIKQKDLMKKWIKESSEDISIICLAICPICDAKFDAENHEDNFAIGYVKTHIEFDHTFNELKEYFNK